MDPVAAVAMAIGSVFSAIGSGVRARYERLPDWLSAKDFQQKDHTTTIILVGMFLVLIAIVVAIALKKK